MFFRGLQRAAVAAIAATIMLAQAAVADDQVNQSRVVGNSSSAPVALNGCPSSALGYPAGRVEVHNRTNLEMVRVGVHFRMFDDGNQLLGQGNQEWHDTGLQPSEDGVFNYRLWDMQYQGGNFGDVRSVTCEVVMAKFANGKVWKRGQVWHGSLSNTSASNSSQAGGATSGSTAPIPRTGGGSLKYTVLAAWVTPGKTADFYYHIRVQLHAQKPESVQASNFRLTLALSNGAIKQYDGMNQESPLVLRGGLLQPTGYSSDWTPAVSHAEDLGYIGKMSVEPGTDVTVVVSYHVPDQVAHDHAVRGFQWIRYGT